jgi:hypothetical protein
MLLTAMNQSFINRIKHDRYFEHLTLVTGEKSWFQKVFLRSDRWAYGDLYGLCYLHPYKLQLEPFPAYNKPGRSRASGRILYIIGDSFLADKTLTYAFDKFDNVQFLDRRFPFGPITLDSAKQNYLLMEFAERNLNGYAITGTDEVRWTRAQINRGDHFNPAYHPPSAAQTPPPSLFSRFSNILFNKDLSRNLELLLFDDRLFTPVKELKAAINYRLFSRTAKEVAVSTNGQRLLLNITVDTADTHSSFRPKTKTDIDSIETHLAEAEAYYKSIGFKQVFLAVIPNPVSIYDSKRMPYNHLLERVEKQTAIPVISVMNSYQKSRTNLFYKSDAHWNPAGFELWVKSANEFFSANIY